MNGADSKNDSWYVLSTMPDGCLKPVNNPHFWLDTGLLMDDESRFIAIGPTHRGVIVVTYSEPEEGVLRIISARMATKNERRRFEAHGK